MNTISIREFRALLGALALLLALAPRARAGGYTMTYQGRLKESGVPVSGNRNIDIQLCNCLSGVCAPVCASSGVQGVTVSSGLFRTTFTLPASVDLAASQQWFLEVRVEGTPLAPREALTVSPYAVFAATAAGLGVASGSAGISVSSHLFIVAGSSVGIGLTNPTFRLHMTGASIDEGIQAEQTNGSNNAVMFLKTNGGATDRLELYKHGSAAGGITAGVSLANLSRVATGGGAGPLMLQVISANPMHFVTNNIERIRIDSAGSVGIGTISPASKLHMSSGTLTIDGNVPTSLTTTGKVGVGTPSPTLNLSLGNTGSQTFGVEDLGAVVSNGKDLSVQSGSGGTSGSGGGGGNLNLKAGLAIGSGNNSGGNIILRPGDKTNTGITGNVEIAGGAGAAHMSATQTTPPTLGGFGLCGTGPTLSIAGTSTDMHGSITFLVGTGGTGPACGANITFNRPYSAAPRAVLLSPGSAAAANPAQNGMLYVSAINATGFSVVTSVGPLASANLVWYYVVIE